MMPPIPPPPPPGRPAVPFLALIRLAPPPPPAYLVDGTALAVDLARYVAAAALAGHEPAPGSAEYRRLARCYNRALMSLVGVHSSRAMVEASRPPIAAHGPLNASQAGELLAQLAHLAQLASAAAAGAGARDTTVVDERLSLPIVAPAPPSDIP